MSIVGNGVLFINSPFQPGADTRVHALLLRHLNQHRFDLHAACPADSPSFALLAKVPGLRLRKTNFGPSMNSHAKRTPVELAKDVALSLGSLAGLVAYVRKHKIRVLHASDRPRDAIPCVLLAKLTGAKSLIHVHVGFDDWMSKPVRWAFGQADALVGVSAFVRGTLVNAGYRPDRTHAVLNAMDTTGWDPTLDGRTVRAELGLPEAAPVLMSISRLFHWKGQADLVRALAIVQRRFPEARLVIVGEDDPWGALGRPSFTAELKTLAAELGVAGSVLFTGWRTDIPRLLAACDVYAMPSMTEPFGLVYLEAMAMKKPVVALNNGGTPEVVDHGHSGLLSPARDLDALAANLIALFADPDLRARMGAYGRTQVETRFTPAHLASGIETIYERLMNGT